MGLTAGCTDTEPGESEESNAVDPERIDEAESSDTTEDGAESATEETNESGEPEGRTDETALDHPSAENATQSPVLGPEPTTAEATLIMFDNPACPACAYFEENAFQELKAYADAGELSIVWRGIPAVEDWADTALQVLWATYERDVDAFWDLRAHAFEIQEAMSSGGEVVDRLTDHLATTTSLSIEAIRSEVEDRAYEREIGLDEDAAAGAGLDATPYFYLFRDGEFRTEIRGAEDHRVFERALEL